MPKKIPPNFYAVVNLLGIKQIVSSWAEAEKLTKGVKGGVKFKGFVNRQDAEDWNPVTALQSQPKPKEKVDHTFDHKLRLSDAMDAKKAIFYTDAAYLKFIFFCGIGVYSPTIPYQQHVRLGFEGQTNQRAEIMAVEVAIRVYEKHVDEYPAGVEIFTDSKWSTDMINTWPDSWERARVAYNEQHPTKQRIEWFTSDNNAVKHQDIARSIIGLKSWLVSNGHAVDISWIPRELNKEADCLSRGKQLLEVNGRLVLP